MSTNPRIDNRGSDLFGSREALAAAFAQGLDKLMDDDPSLGVFILVLANAFSDDVLHELLQQKIDREFSLLEERSRKLLRHGETPKGAPDDLTVLLKLMVVGYDQLERPRQRDEGPWHFQFNMLRAFRPPRAGTEPSPTLFHAFDDDDFNFNKPFLAGETFWRGTFRDTDVALLYNKFPFMPLHGLCVPEPRKKRPQFLYQKIFRYIWQVCEELGESIEGIGFGYNSFGAGASVNHLHFQLFVDERPLPIEKPVWRHHGGEQAYPAECLLFENHGEAWQAIEMLHSRNIGYNLLYRPGCLYLIPRRFQGSYPNADWSLALTWNEMSGSFVLFNRDDFLGVHAEDVASELAKVRR